MVVVDRPVVDIAAPPFLAPPLPPRAPRPCFEPYKRLGCLQNKQLNSTFPDSLTIFRTLLCAIYSSPQILSWLSSVACRFVSIVSDISSSS